MPGRLHLIRRLVQKAEDLVIEAVPDSETISCAGYVTDHHIDSGRAGPDVDGEVGGEVVTEESPFVLGLARVVPRSPSRLAPAPVR